MDTSKDYSTGTLQTQLGDLKARWDEAQAIYSQYEVKKSNVQRYIHFLACSENIPHNKIAETIGISKQRVGKIVLSITQKLKEVRNK